ncbi:hypothetical protein E1B28_001219 [Marasmius oreades]|uniref:AMP-dependent synthetase/ligase domain-containing protein n=1 Tax=Marasmius oreades TaxID=181124 RepID=A0A9P7V345_9AGAR|nr:uncharacterized protein E1B28_001219 [Marasmius oreades]KAG7099363.1 hypothetical protein E1B28_001219 [Marasmius oreades]
MNSFSFSPTPESIPPQNVNFLLKTPPNLPVYRHVLNPLGFLLRAAQIYPDKIALTHPDTPFPVQYTYAIWTQRVQNLAYALLKIGIKPGDRVAVIAPNTPLIAGPHFTALSGRFTSF